MTVSVLTPAYDMHGKGEFFLNELLKSAAEQTYRDFEVVVTDTSRHQDLLRVCRLWSKILQIRHVSLPRGTRVGESYNAAVFSAEGDIFKFLNQDDAFFHEESLAVTVGLFGDPMCMWVAEATIHQTQDGRLVNPLIPHFDYSQLIRGKNKMSCESVLAVRSQAAVVFDQRLWWLLDVDYYARLAAAHGMPVIGKRTSTLQHLGPHQATNNSKFGRLLVDKGIVLSKLARGRYG